METGRCFCYAPATGAPVAPLRGDTTMTDFFSFIEDLIAILTELFDVIGELLFRLGLSQ